MTRDSIIRMAREQGLPETATEGIFIVNTDDLGRILAAEREACAKGCETFVSGLKPVSEWGEGYIQATKDIADGIRARGI